MRKRFLALVAVLLVVVLQNLAGEASDTWGAQAARTAVNPTVSEMLRYAAEDEFLARAEYEAVMKKFGEQRPFSNIIRAEENHIAWLKDAFAARKLVIPADKAFSYVIIPLSIEAALKAGVQAEIDNIGMYESFLDSEELAKRENSSVRDLFIRLRDASKNHLRAFQNGLR
jgi:hypothetical protein